MNRFASALVCLAAVSSLTACGDKYTEEQCEEYDNQTLMGIVNDENTNVPDDASEECNW